MNQEINRAAVEQSAKRYTDAKYEPGLVNREVITQAYLDGALFALNMAVANLHALAALNVMKKD